MMRRFTALAAAAILSTLFTVPAWGWGPRANLAVVNTAIRVISRDGKIPLANLQKDIQSGASVSADTMKQLIPGFEGDPVAGIRSEMYLLQAVYGGRVDPYFAYRLGVLGQAVASVTAPLADANPAYRDRYYADVEGRIEQAGVEPSQRQTVEPDAYFARVRREASAQQEMILKDYESGLGFEGVAKASLPADATRSVVAVADVWYTILRTPVTVTNLSQSQIRDYVVNALEFYIKRGNMAEINSAYERLSQLGVQTPELRRRIGDMFYEAKYFERAMEEYRAVLAAEPGRRDVIERMAAYYVSLGDQALDAGQLEAARDAFVTAGDIDKLNAAAQEKRINAENLIAARDERLGAARQAILDAREFESKSDREAMERRYSEAIDLLRDAKKSYESVGSEFPDEAREASTALTRLGVRMKQLDQEVFQGAKSLTGSGVEGETRRMAAQNAKELNQKALQSMVDSEYKVLVEQLRDELQRKLTVKAEAE